MQVQTYQSQSQILMINGHKSAKVKFYSGARQGDPPSGIWFTVQVNPLLEFLNNMRISNIQKYQTFSNKEFFSLAFMDDANFVTQSLSSLITLYHT